jgi:hypothetical protein
VQRARFRVTLEPPDDSDDKPIEIATPALEPGEVASLIALTLQLRPTPDWGIRITPFRAPNDP